MKAADTNRDGVLSRAEWHAGGLGTNAEFDEADSNNDGVLTSRELSRCDLSLRRHPTPLRAPSRPTLPRPGGLGRLLQIAWH